jgi:glycosyltransferase involved in cell wall biosynthesis
MQLSVLMTAYNHEKYIAQAIDSILMQKVNFEYEIVIGEDCSTDSTRDIVTSFQKRYPDKIRLVLSLKNVGENKNIAQTLRACQGQYIAMLDGDDYWTSPHKLQKQVDFLDNHPECAICFHNVNVVYEDGSVKPHPFHMQEPKYHISKPVPNTISTLEDIVPGNFIQTCSVMFRAGLFGDIPNWYYSLAIGDWPLYILNAEHGNIGYLDEILGVYRVHRGGVWSMNMSLYRKFDDIEKMIDLYKAINRHLNFKYNKEITKRITPLYYKALQILLSEHKYMEASCYAKKYILSLPLRRRIRQKFLFKVILRAYVYDFLKKLKLTFIG